MQIAGVCNDNEDSGGVTKCEDKILRSNAKVVAISSDNTVVRCNGGGDISDYGVHRESE